MASRFTSGITAPTKELEPSLFSAFFRTHADKFIWFVILLIAALGALLIATGAAGLAFLTLPVTLMLYSGVGWGRRSHYEVTRQSIADALTLPVYLPATAMAGTWLLFHQLGHPVLAVLLAIPAGAAFIPTLRRTVRNHHTKVWNQMVRRLESAVIEHVPYAEIDIRSVSSTGNRWDEAEWETKRRRQAAFDAWLAVDLPLQRKLDLMAGGISPEKATDPDIARMSAEDLLTLKAMADLATTAEASSAP